MSLDTPPVLWELQGRHIVVMAILVLYVGKYLRDKSSFLTRNNIPASVLGGVLCSVVLSLLTGFHVVSLEFDMQLRNVLLLMFFSSIGLTSEFKSLLRGGRELVLFVIACGLFLILQNSVGVGLSILLGADPVLGLFGGSISFAGGHGTAIGWGARATEAGLEGAAEIGMACATMGLILGACWEDLWPDVSSKRTSYVVRIAMMPSIKPLRSLRIVRVSTLQLTM